jgi:thiol-disulfide isomerase/thioredoxin
VAKVNEQWERTPVALEPIDLSGVAALVKNPTGKYRLINVWATWCVPCVEEFPDLVTLIRQYQDRDFEVITISVDDPAQQAKVLGFLQKQHAALPSRHSAANGGKTNNFLFQGSVDALQKGLDPEWPGPVPYTLIVAPGGQIVYRHSGVNDLAEIRGKLVEGLGAYLVPRKS